MKKTAALSAGLACLALPLLAMHSIQEATAQNVASARQSETVAHTLHQLGLSLQQLLGKYRQ